MCIIAYGIKKDIGNQRFQNCLTNNPDGFFLIGFKRGNEDNKPEFLVRTLLKKEVVATWEKIPNDYIVLLHARIKTHGSISEKNVHGWNGDNWYFCHNGILSLKNKGDLTDSETFFRYLFLPAFGKTDIEETNEGIDNMVNSVIGSSKFVFWKKERCCFMAISKDRIKRNLLTFRTTLIKKKNIVTALFMVMRFTMIEKPDILNIPRPTITQKNTTHLIAN